jgi:hypothetical protein
MVAPLTIEDLKCWAWERNLPLSDMRFFLGEDYKEPKAFGIYQNTDGNFVVYKNKADGTRAIRYEGPSEAKAVKELYLKMTSEIDKRKRAGTAKSASSGKEKSSIPFVIGMIGLIIIPWFLVYGAICLLFFVNRTSEPETGYYRYEENDYYNLSNDWYIWNIAENAWTATVEPDTEDIENYYVGSAYEDTYYYNFANTTYYEDYQQSSNYSNDDYYWNTDDSWDSGYTDWNSDW